ncbi:hypothetical protein F4604DRAFT_1933240 [Suillus subluteus]|nr:hypothetical protein F4604DRAFT_1933240 [Suillus subluteus]
MTPEYSPFDREVVHNTAPLDAAQYGGLEKLNIEQTIKYTNPQAKHTGTQPHMKIVAITAPNAAKHAKVNCSSHVPDLIRYDGEQPKSKFEVAAFHAVPLNIDWKGPSLYTRLPPLDNLLDGPSGALNHTASSDVQNMLNLSHMDPVDPNTLESTATQVSSLNNQADAPATIKSTQIDRQQLIVGPHNSRIAQHTTMATQTDPFADNISSWAAELQRSYHHYNQGGIGAANNTSAHSSLL